MDVIHYFCPAADPRELIRLKEARHDFAAQHVVLGWLLYRLTKTDGLPYGPPRLFFSFKVSLSTWHDEIIASCYQGNEVFSACGREIFSFHGAGSFASEEQTPNVTFDTLEKKNNPCGCSCCWLLLLLRLCSCAFWPKWLPTLEKDATVP